MNPKLELSPDEMRQLGYRVVDLLVEHFVSLSEKPVVRKASRPEMERQLREPLPEKGAAAAEVLRQAVEVALANSAHCDHPRFFAFIPSPSTFVSAMADTLATGFNVFAGDWLEGSGPAEVELVTIDWLRQLCGLPESAGGLFVSGGSVANLTALAVARNVKLPRDRDKGRLYFSDQTHSSMEKGLRLLGLGPEQMVRIDSDADFRLPPSALERAVASDRKEGLLPFCVVANAGTTNTGAVDPLRELADFCARERLWLHVDGAYGAAAVLSGAGRARLAGLDRVDSLSLDPHKWLFQPFETGCVLLRDRRLLLESFHILPEYMKDAEPGAEEVNFCDYGIQLTRGFRALKLWMSFKIFGVESFRAAVERTLQAAELAEKLLRRSPAWEIVTPAQMGIVSFRFHPPEIPPPQLDQLNQQIVERAIDDGFAMVSSTTLRGRKVLRLCTINPRTTEADLEKTIARLEEMGSEIAGGSRSSSRA
jgi:glutamate/tyrosine decarboxylase-like PLP-dependent enzyme